MQYRNGGPEYPDDWYIHSEWAFLDDLIDYYLGLDIKFYGCQAYSYKGSTWDLKGV